MSGRPFFPDLSGGRIRSANQDGSDLKTILNLGGRWPDGLVLDAAGHSYWTAIGDSPGRRNTVNGALMDPVACNRGA